MGACSSKTVTGTPATGSSATGIPAVAHNDTLDSAVASCATGFTSKDCHGIDALNKCYHYLDPDSADRTSVNYKNCEKVEANYCKLYETSIKNAISDKNSSFYCDAHILQRKVLRT